MTQEQIETMLRNYFWRCVASSKGWSIKENYQYRNVDDGVIYIYKSPFEGEEEQYVVEYANYLDLYEMVTITVPVEIRTRLLNRVEQRRP